MLSESYFARYFSAMLKDRQSEVIFRVRNFLYVKLVVNYQIIRLKKDSFKHGLLEISVRWYWANLNSR